MKCMAMGMVLLALAVPAGAAANNQAMRFEGVAHDRKGQPLYRERHDVTGTCDSGVWRPNRQQVRYYRPGAEAPFARKALDYPASLLRPNVDFHQPAFDERLQVRSVKPDALAVNWSLGANQAQQWTQAVTPALVVDAGFDHFVRAHWSTLLDGGSVGFEFLAASRGQTFGFVAEAAPERIPGADHSLRIRPAGLVMRMLVDPILLGYSDDGLLTHYSGLGNIRRSADQTYQVDIRYRLIDAPGCPLVSAPG